jgi:hypothetical protein
MHFLYATIGTGSYKGGDLERRKYLEVFFRQPVLVLYYNAKAFRHPAVPVYCNVFSQFRPK